MKAGNINKLLQIINDSAFFNDFEFPTHNLICFYFSEEESEYLKYLNLI